jgi:hypothetical protein
VLTTPKLMNLSTAAAISGLAPFAFAARYVKPGLVETQQPYGSRTYIVTASLEAAIGRKITVAELAEAEDRLEGGQRRRQRDYRRRKVEGHGARPA